MDTFQAHIQITIIHNLYILGPRDICTGRDPFRPKITLTVLTWYPFRPNFVFI